MLPAAAVRGSKDNHRGISVGVDLAQCHLRGTWLEQQDRQHGHLLQVIVQLLGLGRLHMTGGRLPQSCIKTRLPSAWTLVLDQEKGHADLELQRRGTPDIQSPAPAAGTRAPAVERLEGRSRRKHRRVRRKARTLLSSCSYISSARADVLPYEETDRPAFRSSQFQRTGRSKKPAAGALTIHHRYLPRSPPGPGRQTACCRRERSSSVVST